MTMHIVSWYNLGYLINRGLKTNRDQNDHNFLPKSTIAGTVYFVYVPMITLHAAITKG